MSRRFFIGVLYVVVVFFLLVAVVFGTWYWAHTRLSKTASLAPVETSDVWQDKLKENITVVCIDGFEYYFSSVTSLIVDTDISRAFLAPKFDPRDRLPKRCAVGAVKEVAR